MDWVSGKGKETNPGHLVFWPQQLRLLMPLKEMSGPGGNKTDSRFGHGKSEVPADVLERSSGLAGVHLRITSIYRKKTP